MWESVQFLSVAGYQKVFSLDTAAVPESIAASASNHGLRLPVNFLGSGLARL